MEQTWSDESTSVIGTHELPPSALFQTPPPGAAKYKVKSVRGSEASLTTRGAAPGGPTKFQATCACKDKLTPSRTTMAARANCPSREPQGAGTCCPEPRSGARE